MIKRFVYSSAISGLIFWIFYILLSIDVFSKIVGEGFLIVISFILLDFMIQLIPVGFFLVLSKGRTAYNHKLYITICLLLLVLLFVLSFVPSVRGTWWHYVVAIAILVIPQAIFSLDRINDKLKE